jgi:NodT family efflux transporter outer membrane factor (OMF) lipoprotein
MSVFTKSFRSRPAFTGRRSSTAPASRIGAIALLALGVSGCTMGPDFKGATWSSPGSWFDGRKEVAATPHSVPVVAPINVAWWDLFNDPELSKLEQRVAGENLDVKAAAIRFDESRAQLGIVRGGLFPTLNANASYTRQLASNNGVFAVFPSAAGGSGANGASGNSTGAIDGAGLKPFDLYQGGFDASWEIDLWGQVRRSVESSSAASDAALEDQRSVLMTSLAEVARDYVHLRGLQAQLQIARDNARTAQQSLDLTHERAVGGVTTDLDVANASAQLRTTLAQIPALQQEEAQTINALSLLLGAPPNALRDELTTTKPVPPVPPRVPVGLPSELARRRPDIREAEAKLHAATADIGVAQANFYPQLTLTGSFGLQSLTLQHAFDLASKQYAFGPGLTIPIFQGGQLHSTLVLRKAQQQEAAVNYQKVVLQAWHDVDNALTAYRTEQDRRDQLVQAVADNKRAVALAQSRYQQGVADFLQVLDSERSLLATQDQLAISTTTVSSNLVALYKALGGGWEQDMPLQKTAMATNVGAGAAQ